MIPDDATIARTVRDLARAIHAELDTAARPDHGPRNVARALADYFTDAEYWDSPAGAAAKRFTAMLAALHQAPRLGIGHVLSEGHDPTTCPDCRTRHPQEDPR